MKGSVFPVLAVLAAAMGFSADAGAQSAFDSDFGAAPPVSEQALSAVTSGGEASGGGPNDFVSQFARDLPGDLSTVDDNITTGLVTGSEGGSFPLFGSSPVGRITHPNF